MTDQADKEKKQILLRLSASLWADLATWAKDDFRSINGQIEYLLSESVKRRKGRSAANPAAGDDQQDAGLPAPKDSLAARRRGRPQ